MKNKFKYEKKYKKNSLHIWEKIKKKLEIKRFTKLKSLISNFIYLIDKEIKMSNNDERFFLTKNGR